VAELGSLVRIQGGAASIMLGISPAGVREALAAQGLALDERFVNRIAIGGDSAGSNLEGYSRR
jgi:hypothetical protein